MNVAYFGCWDRAGHFLFDQSGMCIQSFGPFVPESMDMVFCKPRILRDSTRVCFKDYTVLAFLDNTVDNRPGSNAAFIVEGRHLTKAEIWAEAERAYPHITARLKGHVRID